MKWLKSSRVIASSLVVISAFALNPIGVNAEWKQDSNGWWNTEGSSWSVGWKEIDGKWYYFLENGYMAYDTTVEGYKLGSDGAWMQGASNIITENNNNSDENLIGIDVNLKYSIHVADKIKGINTNIIMATRQAIFDADCDFARLQDYKGYYINNDVLIFDVKEIGIDTWEVDFYEKKSEDKDYNTIGYSFATIIKQKDGSYIGEISHHSTTSMKIGQTS